MPAMLAADQQALQARFEVRAEAWRVGQEGCCCGHATDQPRANWSHVLSVGPRGSGDWVLTASVGYSEAVGRRRP